MTNIFIGPDGWPNQELIHYDNIDTFSVWLLTAFNAVENNRIGSHTRKDLLYCVSWLTKLLNFNED